MRPSKTLSNTAVLLAFVFGFSAVRSVSAQIPGNADVFEKEGFVAGVAPGTIQMLTKENAAWVIQVAPRQATVKIEGTAEPGFLHSGLFVRFSGEIDAKGVLQGEIKELEIFSPTGKNSSGVFPAGSDEKAKPINKLEAGTYDIRGRVGTYKDGEILVVAGKKITGKVAADAKVTVNASDISFAQMEDEVKVRGWTMASMAADPAKGRPAGTAVGTDISIKLLKPLAAIVKKGGSKPARAPKVKAPAEGEPAVSTDDPFGLNKAVEKKK